jgi:hypothetical protein
MIKAAVATADGHGTAGAGPSLQYCGTVTGIRVTGMPWQIIGYSVHDHDRATVAGTGTVTSQLRQLEA